MRNNGRKTRRELRESQGDWETSPERNRFLVFLFAWMFGTLIYAALMFLLLAVTPPAYRLWTVGAMLAAYVLAAVVLFAFVLRAWYRRAGGRVEEGERRD